MQDQILINVTLLIAYVLNLPLNTQRPHYHSICAGEWSLIWAHDSRLINRAHLYRGTIAWTPPTVIYREYTVATKRNTLMASEQRQSCPTWWHQNKASPVLPGGIRTKPVLNEAGPVLPGGIRMKQGLSYPGGIRTKRGLSYLVASERSWTCPTWWHQNEAGPFLPWWHQNEAGPVLS